MKDTFNLFDDTNHRNHLTGASAGALDADGDLLSDEERAVLEKEAGALVTALQSDNTDTIRAVTDQLGQASLTFAERRMDRSIKSALSGVAVSELEAED